MENKDFNQKKKTKLFTVYQILGYILGITFLVTLLVMKGVSFSSYKKTSAGSESATVAKPILTFSNSDYATVVPAGQTAVVEFTVSNDENGKFSETALQYKINIEKSSSEDGDIAYRLYEKSDPEGAYTQVATDENSLTYSQTKQLSAGTSTKHYFKLEYIPYFESSGQPLFDISIDAEQII